MISIAFAVLFIGIGVDFGIQFSMRYRAELHASPGAPCRSIGAAQSGGAEARRRGISGPLGLAALATAVGFYSFLPTDYKGVSELGLIAGTSMFVALIANLTVLPRCSPYCRHAANRRLPASSGRRRSTAGCSAMRRECWPWPCCSVLPARHACRWSGSTPTRSISRIRARSRSRRSRELTADPLASPYSIEILTPNLQAADALADKVSGLPEVRQALTLSSFVPDDQPAKLEILDQTKFLLGPILDHAAALPQPSDDEERAALRNYAEHLRSFLAGGHGQALGPSAAALQSAIGRFLAGRGGGDVKALREALLGGFEGRIDMLRAAMSAQKLTAESMPRKSATIGSRPTAAPASRSSPRVT